MNNSKEESLPVTNDSLIYLLELLPNPETRFEALINLQKFSDNIHLPILLWSCFGSVSALLQELLFSYSILTTISSTSDQYIRLSCVLKLLNTIAGNKYTRTVFVKSNITYLLFPLLCFSNPEPHCEYIRLSTMSIICCLITADDDPEILAYLLSTEFFSVLMRIMGSNEVLIQTVQHISLLQVSTYAFFRIIATEIGLKYVCDNSKRLNLSVVVLGKIVYAMSKNPIDDHQRLLKHIIRCYCRIAEHQESGRKMLLYVLPNELSGSAFSKILATDEVSTKMLDDLISQTSQLSLYASDCNRNESSRYKYY